MENVTLGEVPTEINLSLEEWDRICAESDSEEDAETDEEDWSEAFKKSKSWIDLQKQMQSAASGVQPARRYIGTSRTNIYRRQQALKQASKDTPSLFSFGFGQPVSKGDPLPEKAADTNEGSAIEHAIEEYIAEDSIAEQIDESDTKKDD
ncbi:hypothetical protein BGX28_005290 [Mortierella sp. GBA30]|nr:hypothetical protein BGX28_005290 [Mortierella sp. GBA30]